MAKTEYKKMIICPYCGDEKTMDDTACCGESSMHFVEACDECGQEECECGKKGEK